MLRFSRSDAPPAEKKPRIVDGAGAKAWLAAMGQPGSVTNLLEITEVLNALGARGEQNGVTGLQPLRKFAVADRIRGVLLGVLAERAREDLSGSLPLPEEFSQRFWPAIDAAGALGDVYAWLVSQLPLAEDPPALVPGQEGAEANGGVLVSRIDALHRALDVSAHILLAIQRARWPVPRAYWERHCTLGQLVRDLDCQDVEVADVLRLSLTTTCRAAFVLPIMIALADPASRSAGEFEVLRMAAQRWSKKVGFRIERKSEAGSLPVRPVANPGPTVALGGFVLRFDTQSALASIERRLEALAEGKSTREAGIGDTIRPQAARDLLLSLRQRWGAVMPHEIDAPDRPWRSASVEQHLLALVGLPVVEDALRDAERGADSTSRNRGPYAYQLMKEDALTRSHEAIRSGRIDALLSHAETWAMVAQTPDALRCVRRHVRPRIGMHRLIVLKFGGRDHAAPLLLGWVEALQGMTTTDDDQRLRYTGAQAVRVRLAPGLPEWVRASTEEGEIPGAFLLVPGSIDTIVAARKPQGIAVPKAIAAGPDDSEAWQAVRAAPRDYCLVLPHACFKLHRLVRIVRDGVLAVLRLDELVMRGADFDLVRFTPL